MVKKNVCGFKVIAEMYFANSDWPDNNQKLWRPQTENGKWRWIFFDLDGGYSNSKTNMIKESLKDFEQKTWRDLPVSTNLFGNLLENENFRQCFINRYAELLNSSFDISVVNTKLNYVKHMYTHELSNHITRWNYPSSLSDWNYEVVNNISTFLQERPCVIENHIKDYFGIDEFGFSCNKAKDISDYLIIAPNPNKGVFKIRNEFDESILGNMTITDLSGKIVLSNKYFYIENNNNFAIDISNLISGIYILNVETPSHLIRKKIIIL